MDIEENIQDKMLVDEIVRKTIEEDEKFVIFCILDYSYPNYCVPVAGRPLPWNRNCRRVLLLWAGMTLMSSPDVVNIK